MKFKTLSKSDGFTLTEVMVALAIFSAFMSAYVVTQGYNFLDSISFQEELELKKFALLKINDIVENPPEFNDGLVLQDETGEFDQNSNFTYKITYKRFPDISKFIEYGLDQNKGQSNDPYQKKVANIFRKNLNEYVWQISIEVIDKTTLRTFSISRFLYNYEAKFKI